MTPTSAGPSDDAASGGNIGVGNSEQDHRTIGINEVADHAVKFPDNSIRTSKYNYFDFLPRFLFEQFRKYANIFFLIISCFQQIPNVSPTGKFTTAVPFFMILCVSALKEIFEDFKRHRADKATNQQKVEVIRNGGWQSVEWRHVQVGEFVRVVSGSFFPADIVLLSSSEPEAMCYIETANLDGETNLKIRQGLSQTKHLLDHKALAALKGRVVCEKPNRHLYEFRGNIELRAGRDTQSGVYPLGPEQLLLRGAMLRNTRWIFGIVVYTGRDTKLVLNSTKAPLKMSSVERMTNYQILYLFACLMVLSLLSAILYEVWSNKNAKAHWYLGFYG